MENIRFSKQIATCVSYISNGKPEIMFNPVFVRRIGTKNAEAIAKHQLGHLILGHNRNSFSADIEADRYAASEVGSKSVMDAINATLGLQGLSLLTRIKFFVRKLILVLEHLF